MNEANHPIYSSLKEGEIRILIVRPSSVGSRIECSLVHTSIAGSQRISYEALSYEWGLPEENQPIIILDQRTIPIRSNLFDALHRFRKDDRERCLWVDALCINQKDIAEKNIQVQMMGNIYKAASSVLAWLGRGDVQSSVAIQCFQRILTERAYDNEALIVTDSSVEYLDSFALDESGKEKRRELWIKKQDAAKGRPDPAVDRSPWSFISIPDTQLDAVLFFLARSYWYRAWIVQEIVLVKRAILVCGNDEIIDSDLLNIYDMVVRSQNVIYDGALNPVVHNGSDTFRIARSQGFRIIGLKKQTEEKLSLPDYIVNCQECKCTALHDYVYAFISMDSDCGIIVDYSKSLKELVKEVRRLEKKDRFYYRVRSATNILRERFFEFDILKMSSIPGEAWRAIASSPKSRPIFRAYQKHHGWGPPDADAFD